MLRRGEITYSKEQVVDMIQRSGCSDIQAAVALAEDAGISVADLPDETLRTVVEVVLSGEAFGYQAGMSPTDY